jgi:hypothetical protein
MLSAARAPCQERGTVHVSNGSRSQSNLPIDVMLGEMQITVALPKLQHDPYF